MKLAKVTGSIVCSHKISGFEGKKILLIQPISSEGKIIGNEIAAIDATQAGSGDLVLFESGREAALALDNGKENISDATITAIVDHVDVN